MAVEYTIKEAAARLRKPVHWLRRRVTGYTQTMTRKRSDGTPYRYTGRYVEGLPTSEYRRETRGGVSVILISQEGFNRLKGQINNH